MIGIGLSCASLFSFLINSQPSICGMLRSTVIKSGENSLAIRNPCSAEVAAAVAYLVSDTAAFVTGQSLNVGGGLTM